MRHLYVAVAVVVIVNAQLTWWIVFVLGQNRDRLRLERQALSSAAELEVARLDALLDEAEEALVDAMAAVGCGSAVSRAGPPAPIVRWLGRSETRGEGGWSRQEGSVRLELPCIRELCGAVADPAWAGALLEVDEALEVVPRSAPDEFARARPVVALPVPFSDSAVRPTADSWQGVLDGYRGRITMMVSEGSFFAILLFVMLGLLWKTLRREVELERQHRNFLSAITHELKSPLAAMRLSLETVLRGRADSTASARFLENALQDAERLQSLVQKVLEVTRYGHGQGTLSTRRSDLSAAVEESVETFSRRATAAGASVDARIEPGVHAQVDEEALAIVVSNLLENAVKYGGTIPRIRVRLHAVDHRAILEVEDNGRGIAAGDVPFVFDRFFRGGDEMTRTTQGTGLGLYLVREIVRAHGGTVSVAGTGPEGTIFRVVVPGAQVEEERE